MEALFNLNPSYLEVLNPLVKWRVLDQQTLWAKSNKNGSYKGFQKLIYRFEDCKIVESKIIPSTRKKYLYLSELGEKLINGGRRSLGLNKENLYHDVKLTDVMKELLQINSFSNFLFEHQIFEKSTGLRSDHVPDALLIGKKGKVEFNLAVELELTRKCFDRIEDKAKFYLEGGFYDYVMYFFILENIKNAYEGFLKEKFGKEVEERFMFFVLERTGKVLESKGSFKGKDKILKEVFL